MDQEKILRGLEESIATWNIDDCRRYAEMAMESGIEPDRAINDGLAKGMDRISRGFDRAEIFLPQIMMASKAMEAALEIIEPYMMSNARLKGVVVMGSVKGDIHSIGKNVCCAARDSESSTQERTSIPIRSSGSPERRAPTSSAARPS